MHIPGAICQGRQLRQRLSHRQARARHGPIRPQRSRRRALAKNFYDDNWSHLDWKNGAVTTKVIDPAAHYGVDIEGRSPEIHTIQMYAPPTRTSRPSKTSSTSPIHSAKYGEHEHRDDHLNPAKAPNGTSACTSSCRRLADTPENLSPRTSAGSTCFAQLFGAQRLDRIRSRRPHRRQPQRGECHPKQNQRSGQERGRIECFHAEQKAFNEVAKARMPRPGL